MDMHDSWAGAALFAFDDPPSTADDIDLERVVWDPDYRSAIKGLLVAGPNGRPGVGGQ